MKEFIVYKLTTRSTKGRSSGGKKVLSDGKLDLQGGIKSAGKGIYMFKNKTIIFILKIL